MADDRRKHQRTAPERVIEEAPIIGGDAHEEMTEKQAVILRELAQEAGEPFDGKLTRAQAEERIAHLKGKLGKD